MAAGAARGMCALPARGARSNSYRFSQLNVCRQIITFVHAVLNIRDLPAECFARHFLHNEPANAQALITTNKKFCLVLWDANDACCLDPMNKREAIIKFLFFWFD